MSPLESEDFFFHFLHPLAFGLWVQGLTCHSLLWTACQLAVFEMSCKESRRRRSRQPVEVSLRLEAQTIRQGNCPMPDYAVVMLLASIHTFFPRNGGHHLFFGRH